MIGENLYNALQEIITLRQLISDLKEALEEIKTNLFIEQNELVHSEICLGLPVCICGKEKMSWFIDHIANLVESALEVSDGNKNK